MCRALESRERERGRENNGPRKSGGGNRKKIARSAGASGTLLPLCGYALRSLEERVYNEGEILVRRIEEKRGERERERCKAGEGHALSREHPFFASFLRSLLSFILSDSLSIVHTDIYVYISA